MELGCWVTRTQPRPYLRPSLTQRTKTLRSSSTRSLNIVCASSSTARQRTVGLATSVRCRTLCWKILHISILVTARLSSLLSSEDSLAVTSMLMWRIFQHNVRHLTDVANPTVRCLAVLEEAQTMLSERVLDDRNVFVRWVKEGRKYGLGCVLVTQQPSSISSQIISQGDNFFVLHLLNENDLQTLKKHNAYFSDEILGFIRGEPIPGNCYFWSAPNQPFVLPVRVCNFESICQFSAKPAAPQPAPKPDLKKLSSLVAKAVQEALASNKRVWIYPVTNLHGKKEDGLVAFSREYLQETVAQGISGDPAFKLIADGSQWLKVQLPSEIETVLNRHRARTGYAVLAGVSRAVWILPQTEIKLTKSKTVRSQSVEV